MHMYPVCMCMQGVNICRIMDNLVTLVLRGGGGDYCVFICCMYCNNQLTADNYLSYTHLLSFVLALKKRWQISRIRKKIKAKKREHQIS